MSAVTTSIGKSHAKSGGTLEVDELTQRGDFSAASDIVTPPDLLPPTPKKPGGKRRALLGILALVLIGGGTIGTLYWLNAQKYESTDDATIEAPVIPIGPQVAARVKSVNVADNQLVHKGDILVEMDPTDYQVALDQARASESAMQGKLSEKSAQVDSAVAGRDEARAEIAVADVNAQMAATDHDRYVDAAQHNSGAISKQQMDTATATWRSTDAQVQQARAKLAEAEAQIATARAAVKGAQGDVAKAAADVRRAEVNLSYCTLTAPEDGRITKKSVDPGSYVQVGQNLFAIVPPRCWVVANFKETQLDRVRPGQPVKIAIDAYPEKEFTGKVESIQSGTGSRFSVLPTENATGNYVKVVQRVPVKIMFDPGQTDDAEHPLGPGMSAVPEVKVR